LGILSLSLYRSLPVTLSYSHSSPLSLSLSLSLFLSLSLIGSRMSFFRQVHSSWTRPEGQTLWERRRERERARRGVRQLDERVFCLSAHFSPLFSLLSFFQLVMSVSFTGVGKDKEIVLLTGALVRRLDQHLF